MKTVKRDKDGRLIVPKFSGEQPKRTYMELDAQVDRQRLTIETLEKRLSQVESRTIEILGRDRQLIETGGKEYGTT